MGKGTAYFDEVEEQEVFSGGYKLLPKGKYLFQIAECVDKVTAKGDPMVRITLQCQDDGYEMCKVWDNIVIPKPGSPSIGIAGRTKRFLHCIGEPYEGQFEWDSENWAWKKVYANVKIGTWNDREQNEIAGYILDEDLLNVAKNTSPDDMPF